MYITQKEKDRLERVSEYSNANYVSPYLKIHDIRRYIDGSVWIDCQRLSMPIRRIIR